MKNFDDMISIVIPTLNEESLLARALDRVQNQPVLHEIIVSDGGSTDATVQIAQRARCRVSISPETGRASQLNHGAALARGDLLLFLHADTLLPDGALEALAVLRNDPHFVGGGFTRRFDTDSPFLLATCRLADWRSRWLGLYFGDQALFVKRKVFEAMRGFRPMPVFEDLDFCRRMKSHGNLKWLRGPVMSSPRRFDAHGAVRVTLADFCRTCRYLAGWKLERGDRSDSP